MCGGTRARFAIPLLVVLSISQIAAAAAVQSSAATPTSQPATDGDGGEVGKLAQMDLESLMQVEISTGTLTRTERHLTPAAITFIDRQDIDNANPRSLIELLDIYVPNEHVEHAMWEPMHIGVRGIISDREDKYLLLVNGRVM